MASSSTPAKLEAIQAAQSITDRVYREILPQIEAGVTELAIARELERRGLEMGASRIAFPFIVGSGPNGAEPHAVPGPRKLKRGDLVVLDFGFVVDGYHSDMSRMVAVGKPSKQSQASYDLVLKAQQAAVRKVRAGVTGRVVDAAARDVITAGGYGERFIHTTGHGIGRMIHQYPRISPRRGGGRRLKAGEVITIEPGIYLPGKFGVRIEDMVLVTETGCKNLTKSPKRLVIV